MFGVQRVLRVGNGHAQHANNLLRPQHGHEKYAAFGRHLRARPGRAPVACNPFRELEIIGIVRKVFRIAELQLRHAFAVQNKQQNVAREHFRQMLARSAN